MSSKSGTLPRDLTATQQWLMRRFKLGALRKGQAEVVWELLQGKRVLFVAPTGHGKSLCYQALAASPWSQGIVLVFQPLIALMTEQVERAHAQGLRAAPLHSNLSQDEQVDVLARAKAGDLEILFLAPERQASPLWLESVAELIIKGVVIDEAHCISQWGHDFRPAYRQLIRTTMGLGCRTPVLAVTATAPAQVMEDVSSQISPEGTPVTMIRLPSGRSNLRLGAMSVDGLVERLAILRQISSEYQGQTGLAYLPTKQDVDIASEFLRSEGFAARSYHGGLNAEERAERIEPWQTGAVDIMCATSALGMGIDHANIRWVLHLGLPDSLIRYVQEIGRAGRDGEVSLALAVDDAKTAGLDEWMLNSTTPPLEEYRAVSERIALADGITRTDLIILLDIPEGPIQRILDGLVDGQFVQRDGKPYEYRWIGGEPSTVVIDDHEARETRRRFLEETRRYPGAQACRGHVLATAMGDVSPAVCGICDNCAGWGGFVDPSAFASATRFLDNYSLPLPGSGKLRGGRALALYKVGTLGNAVASIKYGSATLSASVINRALKLLTEGSDYAGVKFDQVACLPSAKGAGPSFAKKLAAHLGLPLVLLEKARPTSAQKRFRSKLLKQRNVRGAFRIPEGTPPASTVLLIDDIWDSGVSMQEAARLFGSAAVYPLTLARTRHTDGQ